LDDSERKRIGAIGRRIVEKHFSIDAVTPRLSHVLKRLVP
jgi:hypothetical protein